MLCDSHAPGSFCTTVLRTRDPQRAAGFYNTLGGWTVEPVAGSRQHFVMLFDGKAVAAIQDVFNGRDEWVPHVSVADIDRTVSRALELGATVWIPQPLPGWPVLRRSAIRKMHCSGSGNLRRIMVPN